MSGGARAVAGLSVAFLLASCAPSPADDDAGADRTVVTTIGIGFETLVGDTDWADLVDHLREADVGEVSLAVGRIDWLAFPPDLVGEPSSEVIRSGRDYVEEALQQLRPWTSDGGRRVTLTIDALAPALLAASPHLAGTTADGRRSDDFPSLAAWAGPVGADLVALAEDIAQRYRPDEVAITEMLADHTFGADDLASFREHSGLTAWPMTADGRIRTDAREIAAWRSDAITELVGRVANAVHRHDVALAVDVRVDWEDPAAGRADSGHDYRALLSVADRLILWCYAGLVDRAPAEVGFVGRELASAGVDPMRVVLSVGLWDDDGTLSADDLRDALTAIEGRMPAGVTPVSSMTEAHWAAIASAVTR